MAGRSGCVAWPSVTGTTSGELIRPYRPGDDDALYDICLRTGDSGQDATHRYTDPRLIGELWVGPYVRFEPELAFVIEESAQVTGYILGARDTRAFEAACEQHWWPPLRRRYPPDAFPPDSAEAPLVNRIHRPGRAGDDVVAAYPSHLHIDLLPAAQGRGLGRALMERLLTALRAAGSPAVHLGVGAANERAVGFYTRLGFEILKRPTGAFVMGRSTTM